MPIEARSEARRPEIVTSRSRTLPLSGRNTPLMMLSRVVLPEPFGPIRPLMVVAPTVNDTPSSATTPPNFFATASTIRSGWVIALSSLGQRDDRARRFHRRRPHDLVLVLHILQEHLAEDRRPVGLVFDVAGSRVEFVAQDVLLELFIIERLGALDGLLEHLQDRVGHHAVSRNGVVAAPLE